MSFETRKPFERPEGGKRDDSRDTAGTGFTHRESLLPGLAELVYNGCVGLISDTD